MDATLRLCEILLALACLQQSAEHLVAPRDERLLFTTRIVLAALLLMGVHPGLTEGLLLVTGILILHRFDGPYNGGSDRMGLLLLSMLFLARTLPSAHARELALGYLAMQVILSYFISGWVKVINPDWRSGQALSDVLAFSAYPVSEALRRWSGELYWLRIASWAVILLELLLPLAMLSRNLLAVMLLLSAGFHLANACVFGLNRFVWVWIATYPSLFWLQAQIVQHRLG